MSDYERLRRGSFEVDAVSKATEQEADELGRAGFDADVLAKASEQEIEERVEEARAARKARRTEATPRASRTPSPAPTKIRDRSDRTVVRREERRSRPEEARASGGAVVSRRSGIGTWLRRRVREHRSEDRRNERAWAREERRERRRREREARAAYGGGGSSHPLLMLLVVVVALYLVFLMPIDRAISFKRDEAKGLRSELSWHVPGLPYYVLALGSDAREGDEVSRTDTMILVRVDPIGGKLTMLSIPRDTMVEIEGYGTQKINAAYAFGGVAGAVRAVHELTGAPISHAALIRFDGIESLVDYLGGVTVDVPVAVNDPYYTGLVLPAGTQEMDGHTAMLFSRVRHGFDLGDYQRQKDQRILIEAIMHKVLSMSPLKMPGVVAHMGGLVGTSMRMYSILPLMLRLKLGGGATIYQASVPSTTAMVDGVSYVIADDAALAQTMDVINSGGDPAALQ